MHSNKEIIKRFEITRFPVKIYGRGNHYRLPQEIQGNHKNDLPKIIPPKAPPKAQDCNKDINCGKTYYSVVFLHVCHIK